MNILLLRFVFVFIGISHAFSPPSVNVVGTTDVLLRPLQATLASETVPIAVSVGKLTFLLPADAATIQSKFGSKSPVEPPSLYDAAVQLAQKTNWYADGKLQWDICFIPDAQISQLTHSEILIAYGLHDEEDLRFAKRVFEARRQVENHQRLCHFGLDCAQNLTALVGPYDPLRPLQLAARFLPWTAAATGRRMHTQLIDLFARHTSDDFCYGLVLFLNQFSGNQIPWVQYRTDASWEKGPWRNAKEFYALLTKCGDCLVPCLRDPQCRLCLAQMASVDPRDQAASYRTLVSYESPLLTNLSRCMFTKHNVFDCDAQIPRLPSVTPLATWRNAPVTEDTGRALLVGHLQDEATALPGSQPRPVSWMVAGGANKAYDQFPRQHQLFYPTARGRDMWYDPVFRVYTVDDGRAVWCHRHYKVRPGPVPATFFLSTLDNGVTSDERWTIVGAADDLSWLVVHYAGAAAAN